MIDKIRAEISAWWESLNKSPREVLELGVEGVVTSLRSPILGVPAWVFGVGILILIGGLVFPVPVAMHPPTDANEIGSLSASEESMSATARTEYSYFYGKGVRFDTSGGVEVGWDDGWASPTNLTMVQSYDAERGVYYERKSFESSGSDEGFVSEKWVTSRGKYFRMTAYSEQKRERLVNNADTYRGQGFDVVSYDESDSRTVLVWGDKFSKSRTGKAQEYWDQHGGLNGNRHEKLLVDGGHLVGSNIVDGSVNYSDPAGVAYEASFTRISLPYLDGVRNVYSGNSVPLFAKYLTPKETYSGTYERTAGADGVPAEPPTWVVDAQETATSYTRWEVSETSGFPITISNQSISAGPSEESAVIQGTVTNTGSVARHIELELSLYRTSKPEYGDPVDVSIVAVTFVEPGETAQFNETIPLDDMSSWSEVKGYAINVSKSKQVLNASTISGRIDNGSESVVVRNKSFTVREGESGSVEYVVQGVFENQNETPQSVKLTIEAYNRTEEGSLFREGTAYSEYQNVEPGETVRFDKVVSYNRWTSSRIDEYEIRVRSESVSDDS